TSPTATVDINLLVDVLGGVADGILHAGLDLLASRLGELVPDDGSWGVDIGVTRPPVDAALDVLGEPGREGADAHERCADYLSSHFWITSSLELVRRRHPLRDGGHARLGLVLHVAKSGSNLLTGLGLLLGLLGRLEQQVVRDAEQLLRVESPKTPTGPEDEQPISPAPLRDQPVKDDTGRC